ANASCSPPTGASSAPGPGSTGSSTPSPPIPERSRICCSRGPSTTPWPGRRVLEAINRAIDRQELLDRALHGFGAPAFGFYTPAIGWAYNGGAHVPAYDPARARALLAEAGLRGSPGRPALSLELLAPPISPMPETVQVLTRQLAAVGIAVRTVFLPLDQLLERAMARHDFDLVLIGGSQGPDPENLNLRFGSRGTLQFMGYESPRLDASL